MKFLLISYSNIQPMLTLAIVVFMEVKVEMIRMNILNGKLVFPDIFQMFHVI